MKVPQISAPHVLEFCASISRESLVTIPVRPIAGLEPGNCFNNLDAVVARLGGEVVMGWTLFEWTGVFIEAEYHSVWKKKDGRLEDPTPRIDGHRHIVFLPDSSVGEGVFPDNHRKPLSDDPRIFEYLREITVAGGGAAVRSVGASHRLESLRRQIEVKCGAEPFA